MGDPKGFISLRRHTPAREPVDERVRHWREFYAPMPEAENVFPRTSFKTS